MSKKLKKSPKYSERFNMMRVYLLSFFKKNCSFYFSSLIVKSARELSFLKKFYGFYFGTNKLSLSLIKLRKRLPIDFPNSLSSLTPPSIFFL